MYICVILDAYFRRKSSTKEIMESRWFHGLIIIKYKLSIYTCKFIEGSCVQVLGLVWDSAWFAMSMEGEGVYIIFKDII